MWTEASRCAHFHLLPRLSSTYSVCLLWQSSAHFFFSFNPQHVYVGWKTLDLYSTRQDALVLLEEEESRVSATCLQLNNCDYGDVLSYS